MHSIRSVIDPPEYEFNGKIYTSKAELYRDILINQAAEQFWIKDVVALAGIVAGQPLLKKRFITLGSSSGTSPLSKLLSNRLGKSSVRLPTLVANSGRVGIAMTTSIGKFTSRAIPFVGWGILAYDVTKILYNTQQIYNNIVDTQLSNDTRRN